MKLVVLLAVLTSLESALGARILAMMPFYGKSHQIFSSAVFKVLIQRGHHVTEFSPVPSFESSENYTHVEIHSSNEHLTKNLTYEEISQRKNANKNSLGYTYQLIWQITETTCKETFQQESVKALLNSNEHFDLVFTSSSFGQESMLVFGHRFKAPTITLQGFSLYKAVDLDAGNSLEIATIPDYGSAVTTDQMTFRERLMNFISTIITLLAYYNYHLPSQEKLIKEHVGQDVPPLKEMVNNISLYLLNTHRAIEYIRPYTPNIVPIGGVSFTADRISLPKNIQRFMDEATEGVIYFSLGTIVPAHTMPKEVLQIYVNVFKKLKQKVLWKINLETIPDTSKNVLITKWIPQPGVLAHPNCVLFITHGGQYSQQETLSAGVPIIGIPFFGDQSFNVKLSEHRGYGVGIDIDNLSEETLYNALTTVLNNPKYRENAKRMSKIYKDQPMSAADSVAYWVEYVLRHKGAHHLRPASAQLSWYQLALIDVVATIFAILFTVLLAIYVVLRTIMSYIFTINIKILRDKKNN